MSDEKDPLTSDILVPSRNPEQKDGEKPKANGDVKGKEKDKLNGEPEIVGYLSFHSQRS